MSAHHDVTSLPSVTEHREQQGTILHGRGLYEKFRRLRLEGGVEEVKAVSDASVRVHVLQVHSAPVRYLHPTDRTGGSVQLFEVPLFLPANGATGARLVIILHGLNEVRYGKLFSWAYGYTALTGTATLIFPLSFHLNRRPGTLHGAPRSVYRSRRQLAGNAFASPFNALRSRHLDDNPCRLVSELRQGLDDLQAVVTMLRSGELAPLRRQTTVHFLGYSLGGYLALTALGTDELWNDSRALLFASGGPLDAVDHQQRADSRSIVIVDERAAQRIRTVVGGWANGSQLPAVDGTADVESGRWAGLVPAVMLRDEPVRLMLALLSGRLGAGDVRRFATLASRIRLLALCNDRIMPPAAIRLTLESPLGPVEELTGGSHEFPFSLDVELPQDLEEARRERRDVYDRLKQAMRDPANVAAPYARQFTSFLHLTATHLETG